LRSAVKKILSPVKTLRFRLTDVAGRTEVRGEYIVLPSQRAHGYHWALDIYVRGCSQSLTNLEYFTVFLVLKDPDVTVETEYAIKMTLKAAQTIGRTFSTKLEDPHTAFGHPKLIAREELLNAVPSVLLQQDGSLTIDVDLQVYQTKSVWYPKTDDNLTMSLMVKFVRSSFFPNVTFMVGDEAFCFHRHVLADRAPALFAMIDEHTSQNVPLTDDADAGTFRTIYHYVYTGEWCPDSLDGTVDADVDAGVAKKTLTLADRYGCTGLKLLVESVMVDQILDASNAAEMLLLGDSLNCALLKEAAIAEIFASMDATMTGSPGWELLVESNTLLEKLLKMSIGMPSNETDATAGLSVGELRDQLLEHGAAVDGSREVLVQRLLLAITAATATAVVA
jgi:BTB/POZ domain